MSYLKFYVKEDDAPFSLSMMTAEEAAAIAECVNEIVSDDYKRSDNYWLEADTYIVDEEFYGGGVYPSFGLLRCFLRTPTGCVREPYPLPAKLLNELCGKCFRVTPRQPSGTPWGEKIEILFDTIDLPPGKGTKVSDLIAAALKQQKSSLSSN